jgi:hypothetical protein
MTEIENQLLLSIRSVRSVLEPRRFRMETELSPVSVERYYAPDGTVGVGSIYRDCGSIRKTRMA